MRAHFPQLQHPNDATPLTYLDTAATSLKPQAVIDRITHFYSKEYGTVRRGVYSLSQHATALYEQVREQARSWLGAALPSEIIYTKGTTEAINLVAASYGGSVVQAGDEIVVTEMEHHANFVPWQLLAERRGAKLRVVPITDTGEVDLGAFADALRGPVKIASFVHVSNALGTVNPVAEMTRMAHEAGAVVMVDGAQAAAHGHVDVQAIGCDFYACSGHKMYGPTGVGLLYGRHALLDQMPPYQAGGDMVDVVRAEGTTFDAPPYRFEAGTPPFAQVIGLGAALRWLAEVGPAQAAAWELSLAEETRARLAAEVPGVRFVGEAPARAGIVAFVIEGLHPFDVGTLLNEEGVCVRVGHHCAQPVMRRFGTTSTIRASFGAYNTRDDVDRLLHALKGAVELLA